MSNFDNANLAKARKILSGEINTVTIHPHFSALHYDLKKFIQQHNDGENLFNPDADASKALNDIAELATLSGQLNSGFRSKFEEIANATSVENFSEKFKLPAEVPAEFFVASDNLLANQEAIKAKYAEVLETVNERGTQFIARRDNRGTLDGAKKIFNSRIDGGVAFLEKNDQHYNLLKDDAKIRIEQFHKAVELGHDPVAVQLGTALTSSEILRNNTASKEEAAKTAADAVMAEQKAAEQMAEKAAAATAKAELQKITADKEAKAEYDKPENMLAEIKAKHRLPVPPQIEESGQEAVDKLQNLRDKVALTMLEKATNGKLEFAINEIPGGAKKAAVDKEVKKLEEFYTQEFSKQGSTNGLDSGDLKASMSAERDVHRVGGWVNKVLKEHKYEKPFKPIKPAESSHSR